MHFDTKMNVFREAVDKTNIKVKKLGHSLSGDSEMNIEKKNREYVFTSIFGNFGHFFPAIYVK